MDRFFLCIETSGQVCSAALCSENGRCYQKVSYEPNSHSKYLTVFIEELFDNYLMDRKKQLLAISVSQGPGSYTGLRIGVSAAKGLSYALDIPLIAISTLDIMVQNVLQNHKEIVQESDFLVPMIDARRMEVYYGIFDKNFKQLTQVDNLVLNEQSFSDYLDEGKVLFFGSGAKKFQNLCNHPNAIFLDTIYPMACDMLQLTRKKFNQRQWEDVAYFEPFYLKPFIPTTKPKDFLSQWVDKQQKY